MIIICSLALMLNGAQVYKQVEGRLVQDVGDVWVVDFSKALNRYPQYSTDKQVQAVNSNNCVIK